FVGDPAAGAGVARVLDERFELVGRQRLAGSKSAFGEGVRGSAQPVGRGGGGAVEGRQCRQQCFGAALGQLAPRLARLGIAGTFPASCLDAREQRVYLGRGRRQGGQRQEE